MGHLLGNELGLPLSLVRPRAVEYLAEHRVEWLFLRSHLLIAGLALALASEDYLTVYWPLRVEMNHLRTRTMRSCSVAPSEMAAKTSGCSPQ